MDAPLQACRISLLRVQCKPAALCQLQLLLQERVAVLEPLKTLLNLGDLRGHILSEHLKESLEALLMTTSCNIKKIIL
jgi:hypothetical protein